MLSEWLDPNHSLKKVRIALAVFIAVLLGGTTLVGFTAPDAERQAVAAVAFIAGLGCLFWLHDREDRKRADAPCQTPEEDQTASET
jgi:hypothetical protein